MTDLFENPIGLGGFEFVAFSAPEKRRARAGVQEDGRHLHRPASVEGCPAVADGGKVILKATASAPGRVAIDIGIGIGIAECRAVVLPAR